MDGELGLNKVDYENIGQTKEQFELLYGDKKKWSRAALAVYDVMFNMMYRSEAQEKHDIKAQTIFAFLVRNKQKHEQMFKLSEMQKRYEKAGKK